MIKVRYSKEGPEEEDARLLEREVSAAKAQLKYRKKYFTLMKLSAKLRRQKVKAILQNIFS